MRRSFIHTTVGSKILGRPMVTTRRASLLTALPAVAFIVMVVVALLFNVRRQHHVPPPSTIIASTVSSSSPSSGKIHTASSLPSLTILSTPPPSTPRPTHPREEAEVVVSMIQEEPLKRMDFSAHYDRLSSGLPKPVNIPQRVIPSAHSARSKWTTHKQVATVETECQPSWSAPRPVFTSSVEFDEWKKLPQPYGGCKWTKTSQSNPTALGDAPFDGPDNESFCTFNGGCSNYQVAHNASVTLGMLGHCHSHPVLEVQHHWEDKCDDRVLVPLRVPQGMYLAHFHDCVMPRLSRVLLNERADRNGNDPKMLLYIDADYATDETRALIRLLGFEYTPKLPTQCFKKIVWACHTLAIDPLSFQYGQRYIHQVLDQQQSALPSKTFRDNTKAADWKTCKKIYAARVRGVANGRRVVKEDALIRFLQEKYEGFHIMYGLETLEQWTNATRDACLLMGSHGGALTHLMFLRPENRPVVLEMDGYQKYSIFWTLAAALRIPYAWMSFHKNIGVDHHKMAQMMQLLGEIRDSSPLQSPMLAS